MSFLSNFLTSARQRLYGDKNVTIVTGNDAADLDSIISSLLFAYLSQQVDDSTIYVPLVKVPKADLKLRPELEYVMEQVQLDTNSLICLEEITLNPSKHQLILIDHNVATHPFTAAFKVVGVVDHHVDEKLYLDAEPRCIDMVGSCVSLVLNQFSSDLWKDNKVIAQLALAPLLIDTVNLNWSLNRTTELDVKIHDVLKKFQPDNYFHNIEKVKSQVDRMSSYDILRRDYKEFVVGPYRIGTSAVTWYFDGWAKRDSPQIIEEAAYSYAQERQLDMEVILTAFDHDREGKGDYRRELAILILNPQLQGVKHTIERDEQIQLKRKTGEFDGATKSLTFYSQGNLKMSRKQVWPMLKQLIEMQ
ncbi:hypothetical protein BDF20DRAFT_826847 [Mycotypha africana]|uniref:uncharacterized protein n=1 Tax=Mycotypha africana TaxID=64632 RepID=UPI00230017F0|nr:uncharacterized protein BDF20DRAFT_826847 [Mycotypha africana]KAI8969341.1 hypothetical protein BDF20DRAFT_826847 [Mycotypha africana]